MQGYIAAKNRWWAVARVVMGEWADAGPDFAERFHAGAGLTGKDIIGAAHGEREPIALREYDSGRPYFNVDLIDLVRRELLRFVVRVIRPIR